MGDTFPEIGKEEGRHTGNKAPNGTAGEGVVKTVTLHEGGNVPIRFDRFRIQLNPAGFGKDIGEPHRSG